MSQTTCITGLWTSLLDTLTAQTLKVNSLNRIPGLGPATYVVNAADLVPKNVNNTVVKYADDTYLVVPADSTGLSTRQDELHSHHRTIGR